MSRLSNSASARSVDTRMPECPRISVLMRIASIARTTSGANGLPTQTACVIDEVVLQLFEQRAVGRFRIAARQLVARAMRAEQLVGIAAEAGRDAVDRLAAA